MKRKYFSVGEAAKIVHMTSESLRHYDRIGLVQPSRRDPRTNYRYYTEQDIVRLNTVHALQQMDLPLQEIKQVLEYDDLEKIVGFLDKAEKKADEKIAALQYGKSKIQLAKTDYQKKLQQRQVMQGKFIKHFPQRVIMLSNTLETPTLENLWNYLHHFYTQIDPSLKDQFTFEDLAGIYTENGLSRLFAVCIRHAEIDGLKILPEGEYLCADCTAENKEHTINDLLKTVKQQYGIVPEFSIQIVVISGILQWQYQIQVLIG